MKILRHNKIITEYKPAQPTPPPTPDEVLLRRCLDEQLGATGGRLVEELKERLEKR